MGGKLGGINQQWMEYLARFIARESLNHTFWSLNPDSQDTGGILMEDWNKVDESKYNIVEQSLWKSSSGKFCLDHEVVLGSETTGSNVTLYYGGSVPTTAPTSTPTAVPTTTPTNVPTTPPVVSELGDVNQDGEIYIIDALLVAQYYVNLDPEDFYPDYADVDCDGTIDIVDALLIAQYYIGLITGFC